MNARTNARWIKWQPACVECMRLCTCHVGSVHERVDLRAHALWHLVLVVVFVVLVMELCRGGDGGERTWRA